MQTLIVRLMKMHFSTRSLIVKSQPNRTELLTRPVAIFFQVRMMHAGDMPVPDFTYYRRTSTKDSAARSEDTAGDRSGHYNSFVFSWLSVKNL